MNPNDETAAHGATADGVRPMRELPDFKVADGDPDVRGWPVHSAEGNEIGRVNDLMVDTAAHRVAFLAVTQTRGDKLLVPVEKMTADSARRAVIVQTVEKVNVKRQPVQERSAESAHAAANAQVQVNEDEIRIPVVEEELVVERRPVVKEELVVKKASVVHEQTVEADLRKERVNVERTDRNANPEPRGS